MTFINISNISTTMIRIMILICNNTDNEDKIFYNNCDDNDNIWNNANKYKNNKNDGIIMKMVMIIYNYWYKFYEVIKMNGTTLMPMWLLWLPRLKVLTVNEK